jgi:hypothetical protein
MQLSKLSSDTKALCLREGLFVYLLLFVLTTIGILSFIKKQTHQIPQKTISVHLVGAVIAEKTVIFSSGSTISDLQALQLHAKEADFDKLIMDERLKSGIFIVPSKGKCSIWVEGQVEKYGLYLIPEDVKFKDLVNYIALKSDADIRYFTRKRRLVSEGETVTVPRK